MLRGSRVVAGSMRTQRVTYPSHRPGPQGVGDLRRAFTREDAMRRRAAGSAGTNLLVQQTRGNCDFVGPPVEKGRGG